MIKHTVTDLQLHIENAPKGQRFFQMHRSEETQVIELLNSISQPFIRRSTPFVSDGVHSERNISISHFDKSTGKGFNVCFYERMIVSKPTRKFYAGGLARSLASKRF